MSNFHDEIVLQLNGYVYYIQILNTWKLPFEPEIIESLLFNKNHLYLPYPLILLYILLLDKVLGPFYTLTL